MTTESFVWSQVDTRGDMPPSGCCHSLVNYKDKYLIMFGGGSSQALSNHVYVFDLETEQWTLVETQNSEVVQPRLSHSAVIYGDKMIVYGGQDLHNPIIYGDLLELDLQTWTWTNLGDVPSEPHGPGERRLHSAHVYGDRMYVVLGDPGWNTPVWYLDLRDYTWHAVPVKGEALRNRRLSLSGHSSFAEGKHLYFFGGYSLLHSNRVLYSNALYKMDLEDGVLEEVELSSLVRPPARYSAALVVYDGRLYLFGGDANHDSVAVYYNDFWRIDLTCAHPCWEEVRQRSIHRDACYPSARSGHASCLAKNALYIMGGELPTRDDIHYSHALFRYPLGLSMHLTLKENALRALTSHGQVHCNQLPLPITLRGCLQRRFYSQELNEEGDGLNGLVEFGLLSSKCN
ncbi:Galactose oxidase, central domain/Kelch motif containing protein, putative [Angomonas deanei]|uniref:Galactose oxidase, central domain/Kelch motif containing protein, putative n=1 Tax=Angomonas deanei TaxID=59799 RepID=A0A7G2CB93_9TRYP|nr:Galactose oxidase, central domain/Kelch motif containing protein, putative [Angomonas deanei]